jgi:glycosyltransferase involved in cell wall biosynthesis
MRSEKCCAASARMPAVSSTPLVSVVIPAFNAGRYLGEAIESVLAQTYAAVETIVVDDGSSDGTAAIARSYAGVELIAQENGGPAAARNRGFAASRGEVVAFHDADDLMTPDKLAVQVGELLASPAIGCVLAEQELLIEEGAELPFWAEGSNVPTVMPAKPEELADEPDVHPMTMVVRREVFERIGGFDEEMRAAEDFDWMLRAAEDGVEFARLPRVLLKRRVHPASLTQNAAAGRAGHFLALKKRIERHRARAAG